MPHLKDGLFPYFCLSGIAVGRKVFIDVIDGIRSVDLWTPVRKISIVHVSTLISEASVKGIIGCGTIVQRRAHAV